MCCDDVVMVTVVLIVVCITTVEITAAGIARMTTLRLVELEVESIG